MMKVISDNKLKLEKNKQQWNFLDRPESPKTLVFNFYELEENSQKMIKKKMKIVVVHNST